MTSPELADNLIHRVNVGDSLTRTAARHPDRVAVVDDDSGDAGYVDDDGVLWFTDRFKDVIKTGGENVASLEVEKAVYAADSRVAEAVVIGLPHERWSEAITVVVVPQPGETIGEGELLAAVKRHLDPYKVPKAVIVADELPKTSTGKIQKNKLRTRFENHYAPEAR